MKRDTIIKQQYSAVITFVLINII